MKEKKQHYESPQLTTVTFKAEKGYASSERGFRLGNAWSVGLLDAWSNTPSSGGSNISSGWTDNGGSAWEN